MDFDIEPMTFSPTDFDQEQGRSQATLRDERSLKRRSIGRTMRDASKLTNAREVLTELPRPGESLHLLHCGHFDGVDLLTVALELSPAKCEHLWIATLGMNDKSLEYLTGMLDEGRVKTATVLLSHYFKHVDKTIFGRIHEQLKSRGCRVAIARSHAKVWVLPMDDGQAYVFEGSGNLRTCKSVEQITLFNDQELARFHAGWIDELVTAALEG